jgi:hypothetical protein
VTHIEQRYGPAAEWTSVNPVLHIGEAGHESDTGKWKLGDGVTAWIALPYKLGVDTVAGQTGDVTLDVTDVAGAAPLASPALTGNPTGPTRATSDNTTSLATTAFVKAVVAALVDSSPAALDTLNELAAALGDDPNFATTLATSLGLKAPLASPAFTGNPTAPTPAVSDDDTSIATTGFVKDIAALGRVGASRLPVLSTMSWASPTWAVLNDATERTALTTSLTKILAASALEIHLSATMYLSVGAEANLQVGLQIGGVNYPVALSRTNGTGNRAYLSGHLIIPGLAAGVLSVEPVVTAVGTVNMFAGGDSLTYTVREVL